MPEGVEAVGSRLSDVLLHQDAQCHGSCMYCGVWWQACILTEPCCQAPKALPRLACALCLHLLVH